MKACRPPREQHRRQLRAIHQRWHRQHMQYHARRDGWHHRLGHSLGARLLLVFLLLALASTYALYLAVTAPHGVLWGAALLLFVMSIAFAGLRRMLRPLRALALGADAFGRGEFGHRVRVHHPDELGHLARRFNHMASEIQLMLDGKRALLLAVSHELRSPLTRARLNAELVDDRSPAQTALLDDLAQMRDLITALLESERLGSGHGALRTEACDLNVLLSTAVSDAAVTFDLGQDLPLLPLDRMRMQLLLRNLLANALRHNDPAQGPVCISTRMTPAGVRLAVRDHGPGVADDELLRLGEPFYRPDAARARSDGGVGLGLSLCKLIASAHRAPLVFRNAGPGLEASLVLQLQ